MNFNHNLFKDYIEIETERAAKSVMWEFEIYPLKNMLD